jgi:hypothetical protein
MSRADRLTHAAHALFVGLVGAQVGYAYLPEQRRVAATRAIVGLMLAASTAEAVEARGARGAAAVASAGAVGFAICRTGARRIAAGRSASRPMTGAGVGPETSPVAAEPSAARRTEESVR